MHYISLSIYPLHFPKFCCIQKQQKALGNCRYLVKRTLAVSLIFYKRIFFESLNIFLESAINQLNYRNIWFPKKTIIFIMTAQVLFFQCFLMPLRNQGSWLQERKWERGELSTDGLIFLKFNGEMRMCSSYLIFICLSLSP